MPGRPRPVVDRPTDGGPATAHRHGRGPTLTAHDPVAVVWTSGTTGMPKGAVFDHANLAAVARGTDVLSQPGDRRLSPLPFAHVGYMTRAWDEIAHGVTTVITPTPWQAADALRIIGEERDHGGARGSRRSGRLMLARPNWHEVDVSSLRVAGTGAARVALDPGRRHAGAARGAGRRPVHLDRIVTRAPAPRCRPPTTRWRRRSARPFRASRSASSTTTAGGRPGAQSAGSCCDRGPPCAGTGGEGPGRGAVAR